MLKLCHKTAEFLHLRSTLQHAFWLDSLHDWLLLVLHRCMAFRWHYFSFEPGILFWRRQSAL